MAKTLILTQYPANVHVQGRKKTSQRIKGSFASPRLGSVTAVTLLEQRDTTSFNLQTVVHSEETSVLLVLNEATVTLITVIKTM